MGHLLKPLQLGKLGCGSASLSPVMLQRIPSGPSLPLSFHHQLKARAFHGGLHLIRPPSTTDRPLHLPLPSGSKDSREITLFRPRAGEILRLEKSNGKKDDGKEGRRRRGGSRFKCLTEVTTPYNQIVVLEVPETSVSDYAGNRVLLLDHSGNVHSVYKRDSAWTGCYWDDFASLPAVIPTGPVGILGLGGGTAARLILELWPSLRLEGFEIDEILVEQARSLLGLSELEVPTREGGGLAVHVEDAFSPSAAVDGGFAGIIVDVFAGGEVASELQQPKAWLDLKMKLKPGGRIMINCGGTCVEKSDPKPTVDDGTWTWEDGGASRNATLRAMHSVFPGQVSWQQVEQSSGEDNCMALTGPLPNLNSWASVLPERLRSRVKKWTLYS